MKDNLKINDLFSVLWNGRFLFFVFFVAALALSLVYSRIEGAKYTVFTIIKTKNIDHANITVVKMRFDNNTYALPMAKHFGVSVESLPEFKLNVVKYYLYSELSVLSSLKHIDKNKEYLKYLQRILVDEFLDLSSTTIKHPKYSLLVNTQQQQIDGYLKQIADRKKMLLVYEKQKQNVVLMQKEYEKLQKSHGQLIDESANSAHKQCLSYILKHINLDNAINIDLLPEMISANQKIIDGLFRQIDIVTEQKKIYEKQLHDFGDKENTAEIIKADISIEQDVEVLRNDIAWGKHFILFFFAMMFLAMGIVFFKEIIKE